MSRTFRLRNLPVVPGSARKHVDARPRTSIDQKRDEFWHRVAHVENDFPCVVGVKRRKGQARHRNSHRFCIPNKTHMRGFMLLHQMERDMLDREIFDVAHTCYHPWVGGISIAACASSQKVYWKQQHNRADRHWVRQTLKDSRTHSDDWDGGFDRIARSLLWDLL